MNTTCPKCGKNIEPGDVFCSHCGTKILDNTTPLSTGQKIKIYLVASLLAPLGLYWFFKFYKEENPYKKSVAKNVLWITAIALVLMLILGIYTIKIYTKLLNSYIPNAGLYGF